MIQAAEKVDSNLPEDNQRIPDAPLEVNLPTIPEAFQHLWGLFLLSGQAMQSGQGLLPLTWQEIKAFIEVNELDLTVWERVVIKKMSDAYCIESSNATDDKRPAPYNPVKEQTEDIAMANSLRIRQNMRAFKGKK